jgi:hypothetical protein
MVGCRCLHPQITVLNIYRASAGPEHSHHPFILDEQSGRLMKPGRVIDLLYPAETAQRRYLEALIYVDVGLVTKLVGWMKPTS